MTRTGTGTSAYDEQDPNDSVGSILRRADAVLSESLDINVDAGLADIHKRSHPSKPGAARSRRRRMPVAVPAMAVMATALTVFLPASLPTVTHLLAGPGPAVALIMIDLTLRKLIRGVSDARLEALVMSVIRIPVLAQLTMMMVRQIRTDD